MLLSRPPSLLEVGGVSVLMSTEEQGVAVLKSLYAVGGIHAPLSVPIKGSRCLCPHPHFEYGGCSSPFGAGAAPCPRSPRLSRPRWCQRGADNAASVAHQRRGLPAAGTATGPPQMKARPRGLPPRPRGQAVPPPHGRRRGRVGGDTAPRHTGERCPAPSRCPPRIPPPVTRGGPIALLTASGAHAGTRGQSGVRLRPQHAPRSRCQCQSH